MGSPFNLSWEAAKNRTASIAEPRISYADYTSICEAEGLDEIQTRTLADLMHDLGYVVYYGDDDTLKDDMILRPEWLTKAIGFVLEDERTNSQKGVLEHSRLQTIWNKPQRFTDAQYPRTLHPFFLRLMEKYDVSYRLEGGKSSLVAQLVPGCRPDLPWDSDDVREAEDNVKVELVCQLSEDPPGLIPWLIVRTHHFSTRPRLHWQRGLFLDYQGHGTALLELREREMRIVVRAAWPNYFLEVLRYTLERLIQERWPGLEYTVSAPCPRRDKTGKLCKGRFPLSTLHKLKSRFDRVPCMTCSGDTPIDRLLTGLEPPGATERLSRVEHQIDAARFELAKLASENASQFRSILRAMNDETREAPHLFTLLPYDSGFRLSKMGVHSFLLTLWCEMPGHQHPTCVMGSHGRGEYVVESASGWLKRIAPYASLVAKTLKALVPVTGGILNLAFEGNVATDITAKLDLMWKSAGLLEGSFDAPRGASHTPGALTQAEGAALRELYVLLNELDPTRIWGGLRRTVSPSGEYLWLCEEHYRAFEPGLPDLDE